METEEERAAREAKAKELFRKLRKTAEGRVAERERESARKAREDLTKTKAKTTNRRSARLKVVVADDITLAEIADILIALNVLHKASSGEDFEDPVIQVGRTHEVPSGQRLWR